jgi:hypothetical protein
MEWFLLCMRSNMRLEIAALGTAVCALIMSTMERFLFCMRPNVHPQGAAPGTAV